MERARIIIVDEVDKETSVESILVRHGEQRLSAEEFEDTSGICPATARAEPNSWARRDRSSRLPSMSLPWLKTSHGWARAVWKRSRRWGASSIGWAAYLVSG